MLNLESAKKKVVAYLDSQYKVKDEPLVMIREDFIVTKDYGWIFSYESKRFLETGELRYRLVGNYPLLIFKDSGEIYPVDTIDDLEKIVKEHQASSV